MVGFMRCTICQRKLKIYLLSFFIVHQSMTAATFCTRRSRCYEAKLSWEQRKQHDALGNTFCAVWWLKRMFVLLLVDRMT